VVQEPDGAKQITFPRDIEGVRKKDDRRKLVSPWCEDKA